MRAVLSGVFCVLLGCAAPSRQSCELEPPRSVVMNAALGFDGLAVTALAGADAEPQAGPGACATAGASSAGRALYVWSDASGLWAKLSADGRAVRLAERCAGGVAAASSVQAAYVACSRPLLDPSTSETEVVVYRLDEALQATLLASLGRAGRDGRGVALAVEASPRAREPRGDGDTVQVAFHDGSIGEQTVLLASVHQGRVQTQQLSQSGQIASEPALLLHDGQLYVAFTQLELAGSRSAPSGTRANGEPASSIWLSKNGAPARVVARTQVYSATPKLTADAEGLVLSYRDKPRSKRLGGRSELFVVRLDPQGVPSARSRSVGRANTDAEPSVFGCGTRTTALLPREYGGERFVAINALDGALESLGAGHQLYSNGREFVLASGACIDGSWTLFAAERAAPGRPGSEAVSMQFSCRQ